MLTPFRTRDPRLLRAAIICGLLGLALLWPMLAWAKERPTARRFVLTASVLAGMATIDAVQSIPCLQSPTCRELNPLYRSGGATRFVVIKATGLGAATAAAWTLRSKRPKTAWIILGGLTAVQTAVVIHNARALRRR